MKYYLSQEEEIMLKCIYTGHNTLADLVDFLGKGSAECTLMVDRLEFHGYLIRKRSNFLSYLEFYLTTKGKNSLPDLSEVELELATKFGISLEDYKVLKVTNEYGTSNSDAFSLADKTKLRPMMIVSCCNNLELKGYLKMTGITRRYLKLTDKGKKIISTVSV